MTSVLFKNGKVVKPDGVYREDLLVSGGKVEALGVHLPVPKEVEVRDCSGRLIFPGIIDPHTHMGIPIKKIRSADNFESGSRAAVHGGVTTIIDFTILAEGQGLQESVNARRDDAKRCFTDYSLHANLTRISKELLDEIPQLVQQGIVSFKVFTTYREAGMMLNYNEILQAAEILAAHNCTLMVHAEDDDFIQSVSQVFNRSKTRSVTAHGFSRPVMAEVKAVTEMCRIAEKTGCRVYIVHLSSEQGLMAVNGKAGVFLETCPQYLLLENNVFQRPDGRMFVTSPPLRRTQDNHALWQGLLSGTIHTIGTDHCPFNLSDKPEQIPFQEIPNGMGGIETAFPVLLAQFIRQNLPLGILSAAMSETPARLFGLYPRKGNLGPGADADLVIVNPESLRMRWTDTLVSATDWNGFLEFPALFPDEVWLRGECLVSETIISNEPSGMFIPGRMGKS